MKFIIQLLMIFVVYSFASAQEVDTIKSKVGIGDSYEMKFESYKTNEYWGLWVTPIGFPICSNNLVSTPRNTYKIENIHDINLKTAWVVGDNNYGIGEYACFKLPYGDNIIQYNGRFTVFNGV